MTPYLILHKVRGLPAFDIAHKLEFDETDERFGEDWWIVSTSGRRAYPLLYWKLSGLYTCYKESDEKLHFMRMLDEAGPIEAHPGFIDWPDHFSCDDRHEASK